MDDKKQAASHPGKFGLIDHITRRAGLTNKSTLSGVGDDAAVLAPGKNRMLVSVDLMLEGIHFNLTYTPLKHLGYKAVIRAISDIYAMNGTPEQIFVSIGISSKLSFEQIDEIFEGIDTACKKYNVDLAGGDTSSSLTGLINEEQCRKR
jgi:thiamine-monophosphate kinase